MLVSFLSGFSLFKAGSNVKDSEEQQKLTSHFCFRVSYYCKTKVTILEILCKHKKRKCLVVVKSCSMQ